ncbi:unnamed protein product, partial [Musa acuminata subsp. malaccensis]
TKALDDGREERRRLRTLIAQGFRGVSRHLPRLLHPMKRSKFRVIEQVLGFFESVLMSCFFGCFRIKDDARRKTDSCANSISSEDRVSLVSTKELASDSLFREQEAYSCVVENIEESSFQKDLEIQAKFLKNCGALSKIPEEILRTPNKIFSQASKDDSSLNFPLRLPGLYGMDDNLDEQSDPRAHSVEKLDDSFGLSENEFEGSILEEQETVRKVLQFDVNKRLSQVDPAPDLVNLDISPSRGDSKPQRVDSSDSPYPTPLNLTNEMQTPGTVYPVNLDSLRTGKHTRIRTQYVYPVLKPVENLPQWDALRRGSCQHVQSDDSFEQQLSSRTDSVERRNKVFLTPARQDSQFINSWLLSSRGKKNQDGDRIFTEKSVDKIMPPDLTLISSGRDRVDVEPDTPELIISSLSRWLKPKPLKNRNFDVTAFISNEQSCPVMNFDAERPIIGTVAAHWTDDDACSNSHGHWNGNGIPNSTTKYKEDQRVSWHATPFEERLDKVLSDEKLLPQRYITPYVIQ